MYRFTTVLLLLVFCATLKAEKFDKIGSINIRGLSDLTPKLTQLIQKVDPSKKSFPVIGAAAITFNPEMRGFDLNGRIKFFYFVPANTPNADPAWCMLVNRVSGVPLPEEIDILGGKAFTKAVDTRALVSDNSALLNYLSEAPALNDTPNDIEIQISTAALLRNSPKGLDKMLAWTEELLTSGDVSPAEAEKLTRHNVLMKKLLAQTSSITISFRIRNDRLEVIGDLVPEKKSALAEFIALQANNDNSLPGMVSGKNIAAVFNVSPFEPARESMVQLLMDLEPGLNKQEQKDYASLMQNLVDNCNGKISYFMEEDQSKIHSYARFYCEEKSDAANIDKMLKGTKGYPVLKNGFSQIYAAKNDEVSLFAMTKDRFVVFTGGSILAADAEKVADSIPAKLPDLEQYGMLYANANFNNRQYFTAEIGCAKTMTFKITLFAAFLKKFVPDNIEKQQGK